MTTNNILPLQFVIIPKTIVGPFFETTGEGCIARAEQIGNNVVTCYYIGTTNADAIEQANLVRDLISNPTNYNLTKRPDGISISVIDEEITGEVINYVHDLGIPIITYDSDAPSSKRQVFIGTDNYKFGLDLGKVLDQINPNGTYYGIITNSGPNLDLRIEGIRYRLQGDELHPTKWKEVGYSPLNCERNVTRCYEIMYRYAKDPRIKAIIPVTGWLMSDETLWKRFRDDTYSKNITTVVADTSPVQVELMNRDYVNGLVGQMPFLMGNFSVNELLRLQKDLNTTSKANIISIQKYLDATSVPKIISTPLVEMSRIPHPLPPHIIDNNYIGNAKIFAYIAFSIVTLSSIGVAMWVWFNRNSKVVRSTQPSFLLMICAGTLVLGSSTIPLTFDDENGNQKAADTACMVFPWLFFLGFTTSFAALFSKTWRIYEIFKNAKSFKRVQVTPRDVLLPYVVLLGINIITLICWTAIAPMKYVRDPLPGTDDWNRVISTYGHCSAYGSTKFGGWPYIIVLSFTTTILLIIANVYAYRSRHIQTEYSESQCIAIIMASALQVCLVGFPIAFLTATNSKVTFIIMVSMIFAICMDVLGFVFIPKIRAFRRHRASLSQEEQAPNGKSNGGSNNTRGLKFSVGEMSSSKDLFHPKNDEIHAKIDDLSIDEKVILNKFLKSVTGLNDAEERKKLLESRLRGNDIANGNHN